MSDTFEFEDKAKVDRLIGTLHDPAATPGDVLTVQPDKSIAAAAGGGGSAVQASYGGIAGAPIADGASGQLTFDSLDGGVELLDRSDLANPTLLSAGTYAISVQTSSDDPHSVSAVQISQVELSGAQPAACDTVSPCIPGSGSTAGSFLTFIADAGDTLILGVINSDGGGLARAFYMSCILVKLA